MKYLPCPHPAAPAHLALAAPLLLAMLAATPAQAQPAPAAAPPSEATATAAAPVIEHPAELLMLAFGRQDGLLRLSRLAVDQLQADPHLAARLAGQAPAQLSRQLADRLCRLLQGPCAADALADTPTSSAAWLGPASPRSEQQALAAALRQAMQARAVPAAAQDALLARLAPSHAAVAAR